MKVHKINSINSLILMIFGLWGFIDVNSPMPETGMSMTALIPVIFGFILLLCSKGIKNSNKVIAHIGVLVTVLILIGLGKPLGSQIEKGGIGLFRVSIMMLSSLTAFVYFIRSFIANRSK